MTNRLWIAAAYHSAFLCGGWGYVRGQGDGQAGGQRNTTAQTMTLTSLLAALKDLPAGHVHIHTSDAAFARLVGKIAAGQPLLEKEAPTDNLPLWAQLTTALKRHPPTFTLSQPTGFPGDPAAFAQAWADLAMDKAKAAGPFTAAIPKPNLAKLKLGGASHV